MDWGSAVYAMRNGAHVFRSSDGRQELLTPTDELTPPVYVMSYEPIFLAAAWSVEDEPVLVFCGLYSKTMFVPDDAHRAAIDWEIVE